MAKTFRILHCMRAPVGGLFRHVLDLAGEQAARGHEVGILADANARDRLTDERFAAIEPKLKLGLHRAPMSRNPGIGDIMTARLTARLATQTGANILHGHGAKGGAYARLAARLLKIMKGGVTCFYTPHGGSLHYQPGTLSGTIFLRLEKLLARSTDGLIFESAYAHGIYGERIGFKGVEARVIPNGLLPFDFARHEPVPDAADVLFIGELRALKGVDVLLEALKGLNTRRPATAVIVGAGPEADQFKAMAQQLGLGERVTFPGAMPAATAFPLGRSLAVPSRAESFPYIVLEAGAAGIPLVATNVGGIPEIVADTDLVAPGDVNQLADALKAVIADPAAAQARASRLRDRVKTLFTVEAMTDAVLAFYAAKASR